MPQPASVAEPSVAAVVLDAGDPSAAVEAVRGWTAGHPSPDIAVVGTRADIESRLAGAGLDVMAVHASRPLTPDALRNLGLAVTSAPVVVFMGPNGDALAFARDRLASVGPFAPPGADGPRAADIGARRPRMLAMLTCRNERRHLDDYLANVAPQFDGLVALDDGSSDGTGEILARHPAVLEVLRIVPRTPHRWNGVRHRRLLVDAAARHGADWVLALDADERVERTFRERAERIIADAGPDGPMAYAVALRELWGGPDQYRVDGLWGRKAMARLFRIRTDHDFGAGALHGHWAPENSRGPGGPFVRADLIVYHLKMMAAADRERRMRRYQALDPDRQWQKIGYDYLVDETGLELERLPEGREYVPMPARVEPAPPAAAPTAVDLAGRIAMVDL